MHSDRQVKRLDEFALNAFRMRKDDVSFPALDLAPMFLITTANTPTIPLVRHEGMIPEAEVAGIELLVP